MTAIIREPECVVLKRRGAEHVAKLLVGMSLRAIGVLAQTH